MTKITRLNDGWQRRENPTAPLDRVVVEYGGRIGAVVEVENYVPPTPNPLETQLEWVGSSPNATRYR